VRHNAAVQELPYGAWPSPLGAADVARQTGQVAGGTFVGDEVWWAEARPDEGGRIALCRRGEGDDVDVLLPAPRNARTRLHEYGGGAWTVVDGDIVFAEFADQRLYRCPPGGEPRPLTPAPQVAAGLRYADLTPVPDLGVVLCVRECHGQDGTVTRDLCAVPLDGSGADDEAAVRSVVGGSHFYAHPRLSPDRRSLAWIAWDHPRMPWDGTELRIARVDAALAVADVRTLAGGPRESLLQPEWRGDTELVVLSDRSGWWNPCRVDVATGGVTPMLTLEQDIGGPLWMLGARWHVALDDRRELVVRTYGTDTLAVLDVGTGELTDIDLPFDMVRLGGTLGERVLVLGAGARVPSGLYVVDVAAGTHEPVRTIEAGLPDAAYWSPGEQRTFRGVDGRDVHAVVYPPHSPDATAPAGERPPYIVHVHGGPTAHVTPRLDPAFLFWTTRGIGVVDVNYGGSTGYGRAYRERLREQWGIVDVEDVVAVARGLADEGAADGARLAIEGGSAGGWTVLAALTTTDAFCCGVSYFGVAELEDFARTTHDFESRYLDGLIGPLPEARDRYVSRAPVNNVDGLSCPVLLLQGLEDKVVPPAQAEVFRDAMVRKGIPHAYIAYEGEAHGFRRAETVVSALEASLSFYGQVMGFEPPGVPRLELWQPSG
jgi:acetyl esterase/lipase